MKTQVLPARAFGGDSPSHLPESHPTQGVSTGRSLQTLVQQIRVLGRSVDTTEERAIVDTVTAVELLLLTRAHTNPTKGLPIAKCLTERGEEVKQDELRGTIPRQQVQSPCGVRGRRLEDDKRLASGSWLVHNRCAVERAAGADERRDDDRIGEAIRGATGVPRRGERVPTHVNSAQDPPDVQPKYREGGSPTAGG